MSLIIVESPTKAITFNKILDKKKYFIFASVGHIRDLPQNELAIDYNNNFKPTYKIIKNKKNIVKKLLNLAKNQNEIILATDPDREGESIAYHLAYILGKAKENWPEIKIIDKSLKRIVFHEITKKALDEALEKPESLRIDLVKAQLARRIIDRIVGYELSPILWKKTAKNWLSAGRVQTVALKLIVEREKEIKNFKIENYYNIYGEFITDKNSFIKGKLIAKNNQSLEIKQTLKLFAGEYTYKKTLINQENLNLIKTDLLSDSFKIINIEEKIEKRYPASPLTTSLMQQEAFYLYGFSSKLTMTLAQKLYEKGLITYHRTDSFNLSTNFLFKARDYIKEKFGENYLSEKPRIYKTKSKTAQEAHEAIRPTNLLNNINNQKDLNINHKKLYNLIFYRAVATQMKEAQYKIIIIDILSEKQYLFRSEKTSLIFDGFLKLLKKDIKNEKQNKEYIDIKINEILKLKNLQEEVNQTKPPPRYNEASLIKILEEKGIGRPSTYAAIINLIQQKNYVEKENRYFISTNLGNFISDYLSEKFPDIFDLDFTAKMEDNLDKIANKEEDLIKVLKNFFDFFKKDLNFAKNDKKIVNIEEKSLGSCPLDNGNLIVRYSKFGKFIACLNYPKCKYTKKIEKVVKNKKCPKCGGEIVVRYTKSKKKFYGCLNYPKCDFSTWKISEIKN